MALVDDQCFCGAKKPTEKSGYLTEEPCTLVIVPCLGVFVNKPPSNKRDKEVPEKVKNDTPTYRLQANAGVSGT